MQNKIKVSEVEAAKPDERTTQIFDVLADLTLSEAVSYLTALRNAIQIHTQQKTKEWEVKDLEIKLLD